MKWTDWITLGIALLGAALGLWNAWQAHRDRSVRFKIRVTQSVLIEGPDTICLSIEVTNLSAFTITIDEVGLTIGKPRGSLPGRAVLSANNLFMGTIPMRIEPRHSGSVTTWPAALPSGKYDHAYARTSGGDIAYGTSPALLQWVGSLPRI